MKLTYILFALVLCYSCDERESKIDDVKFDGAPIGMIGSDGTYGGDDRSYGGDDGSYDGYMIDNNNTAGIDGEEEVSYNYLVVVDNGNSDTVGTSGADVYGLAVSCDDGDAALTFESASFGMSTSGASCTAGTDCVCTEEVEGNCGGTNRGDTNNILNGSEDAYYSMGNGGHAIFAADMNLDGCDVSFNEVKMDEDATAWACTTAESSPSTAADCVGL
jgi:hypothetical protein